MRRKVFIIAEAGVNHNGDLNIAKRMIDSAAYAGADAIKFQTFKAEKVISVYAEKAAYQKLSTDEKEGQLEMVKKYELDENSHRILYNYCIDKKINFISTPFDLDSIDLLNALGVSIFKIPSGEITNLPYLRKIGGLGKKVILSTGMSDLNEVKKTLSILFNSGTLKENIVILHCNTEYPTPIDDVNLSAMLTLKKKLKVSVGYSDHTLGIEISIAAAALGATVIEKHFTLDKKMTGPDHKASLDVNELKTMIKAIRNIELAIGDGIKRPSKSELKNKLIVRKSIVASKLIKKGEIFSELNITVKRPGMGIDPMNWDKIIGKKAKRDFIVDELIEI